MKEEFSKSYVSLEQNHWWFRARRVILRNLMNRHIAWGRRPDILEIGVGPGENLYTLYPKDARVIGVEPDAENAAQADARGPYNVYCGTIEALPEPVLSRQYDAVCLFDVLEHIQDDVAALGVIHGLLKPGGFLVLTVPCYQWMWGLQDDVNLHYRRYTRSELKTKLLKQGFQIKRATYFNSLLFPVIALFRLLAKFKKNKRKAESDFEVSIPFVDSIMYGLFRLESPLLRVMNFPFGVSCAVIATSDGKSDLITRSS